MHRLSTALCLGTLLGCGAAPPTAPPTDPLAAVTVPALPDWTDRYASDGPGDARFFNISKLMAAHTLTRLQAVALQNHYRDLTRDGGDRGAAFDEALARVRRGEYEPGLDPDALAKAAFIVVFDLDDTLYDQYRAKPECQTFTAEQPKGPRSVLLIPGWRDAFDRIRAAGGLVVLFSANLDDTTYRNLRAWHVDGSPLLDGPLVSGVLTNSHLVVQETTEGAGAVKRSKGQPVAEPSKDLRIFDETLERVVIVDDNPLRLFQFRNHLPFKKFHACAEGDHAAAYEKMLGVTVDRIVESAAHAKASDRSFADAVLPFTTLGLTTTWWLADSLGWALPKAVEYVRAHPDVVDARY